jgi:ubiquinone/menaquinone biosynthesis C-methylase UbiE
MRRRRAGASLGAMTVLEQIKQGARATWAAGDYPAIAQRQLWPLGERIVRRAALAPGEDVLDVACGTGNAALRAAQAGARVTAVDITPELLEEGRRLAAESGLDVEWLEGDAEALPVAAGRFDVVLSVMGCMFAPRHRVAAAELARVLRPGGRLYVTGWAPDGAMGAMFKLLGGHLPPPPPPAESPLGWGSEEHVRELFAGTGVELAFAREHSAFATFDSLDEEIEFATSKFGPLIMARRALEPQGRWQALVDDLRRFSETRPASAEYLVTTGRKLGGDA